jgi:hypothetical protein
MVDDNENTMYQTCFRAIWILADLPKILPGDVDRVKLSQALQAFANDGEDEAAFKTISTAAGSIETRLSRLKAASAQSGEIAAECEVALPVNPKDEKLLYLDLHKRGLDLAKAANCFNPAFEEKWKEVCSLLTCAARQSASSYKDAVERDLKAAFSPSTKLGNTLYDLALNNSVIVDSAHQCSKPDALAPKLVDTPAALLQKQSPQDQAAILKQHADTCAKSEFVRDCLKRWYSWTKAAGNARLRELVEGHTKHRLEDIEKMTDGGRDRAEGQTSPPPHKKHEAKQWHRKAADYLKTAKGEIADADIARLCGVSPSVVSRDKIIRALRKSYVAKEPLKQLSKNS